MDVVADFLNIGSITAFLGALSAYLLVHFSDHRRISRKHKLLYKLIEASLDLCQAKIETVKMNKSALVKDNTVIPAPIMKFALEDIQYIKLDVLDRLSVEEKRALDGLRYTMSEIDNCLDQILELAECLYSQIKANAPPSKQKETGADLNTEYEFVLANLRRLEEMAKKFLEKDFKTIITKKYNRSDYMEDEVK